MMENQNDEKKQGEALDSKNPPPYSETEPSISDKQYPLDYGPAPALGFVANPAIIPPQYQPYGVVPGQGPVTEPLPHTTIVVPAQSTHEPDYLAYSIFTTVCCFLPLGTAALVYSILTRDANRYGDAVAARQNSRKARILAHSALGAGLVVCTAYIVYFVLMVTVF